MNKLNATVTKINLSRKKNYQKPLKLISKSEYLIFIALLIAASQYSKHGRNLWKKQHHSNSEKMEGLSMQVDFSSYMMEWRFNQIKQFIPSVMEEEELKDVDDWWRFSERVKKFNELRKKRLKCSGVIVLDESMSAFTPR